MATKKKKAKRKGLTDKELAKKYDTGGVVNFEKAIELMAKRKAPKMN